MTREEILKKLEDQYMSEFSDKFYPTEFKAQAYLCECNFGGMLLIESTTGEECITWSDWADTAVSHELSTHVIVYPYIEDGEADENGMYPCQKGFYIVETFYNLNEFMLI